MQCICQGAFVNAGRASPSFVRRFRYSRLALSLRETTRLSKARERLEKLMQESPVEHSIIIEQALGVLDLMGREFGRERRNNGHSTVEILLGSHHPWPNIILSDLSSTPSPGLTWENFVVAVDANDPIGALKIVVAQFLAMSARPADLYAKMIGVCRYFLQMSVASHLLSLAKADGALSPLQLAACYNEMLNCCAKAHDYSHATNLLAEMQRCRVPLSIESYSYLMEAFVKATELEVASRIAQESDRAYARTRQSFLRHIVEEQRRRIDVTPALDIYKRALGDGHLPNVTMLTLMLELAARGRNVELAERVLAELRMLAIPMDEHICSLLTHIYASAGLIDKAEETLDRFCATEGRVPTVYSLNALLEYYCDKGNAMDAMRIFKKMEEVSPKPPFIAFSMLLGMFLDLDRIFDALQVLEKIKASGHTPSRRNYNDLLAYYCRQNQYSQFFALVKHLEEEKVEGDKFERTMIISMYGKNGKVQELIEFWHKLKQRPSGQPISLAEYSSMVRYLLQFDVDDVLREVVEHLGRTAIFSCDSLYASRTFLHAFARLGEFDAVHQCLERLVNEGSPPDIHMYNMVLHSVAQHGRESETPRILSMMEHSQCRKSNTTFALAFYLAGAAGNRPLLSRLWKEYLQSHPRIMSEPVRSMMIALCRMGRAKEATEIFEEHVRPNESLRGEPLFSMYIEALIGQERIEEAWKVLDEMNETRLWPNVRTYNIFLDHYSRTRNEMDFNKVVDRMRDKGIVPNAFTFALHVRLCVLQGRYEEASAVVGELQQTDAAVADTARLYLINGLLQKSRRLGDGAYRQAREHTTQLSTDKTTVYVAWLLYFGRLHETDRMQQTLDGILAQGTKPPRWVMDYCERRGYVSKATAEATDMDNNRRAE